ncbi:ArsC family reductase [Escherichia coli]|nr:ArsC family reductase [Escherichia coli]
MVTLYGIKNCDTIKKARRWLEANNIDYRFHDYRVDGLDSELLNGFINELGWEALLNTRGTTWRKLKWFTEFGHLNRGDMLTSEQHRCHNEKKKFQRRV